MCFFVSSMWAQPARRLWDEPGYNKMEICRKTIVVKYMQACKCVTGMSNNYLNTWTIWSESSVCVLLLNELQLVVLFFQKKSDYFPTLVKWKVRYTCNTGAYLMITYWRHGVLHLLLIFTTWEVSYTQQEPWTQSVGWYGSVYRQRILQGWGN